MIFDKEIFQYQSGPELIIHHFRDSKIPKNLERYYDSIVNIE